ncbi:MAG: tachylectin-related carbohydrate-binding protein [Chloroflexota bacterium]
MGFRHIVYAGNGNELEVNLPRREGVIYGVRLEGAILWYRYEGDGAPDRLGSTGWDPKSGNAIGAGWIFKHVLGCGNGVVLAIQEDGVMRWYKYLGSGFANPDGNTGWKRPSGTAIGTGWHGFRSVFATPYQPPMQPLQLNIYAVDQDGALRWYRYQGSGQEDPTGGTGWHPNSGNRIGNGWQNFRQVFGSGGSIYAIHENGNLLWYRYTGEGEEDRSGSTGWHPNSGNPIGNGWQGFRTVVAGTETRGGVGDVLYAVDLGGDLLWYRYEGQGEANASGSTGWSANSGNRIGRGW